MMRFEGKKILVAVTGGIAAYKACDFIRQLYREGADEVRVMMTASAESFIPTLTLESLSRYKVLTENLENTEDGIPVHIAMAQDMDIMAVVPATANIIARMAAGAADDLITTTAITFTGKPILIAPAMNTRMWENPLVQRNLRELNNLPNIQIVPPDSGILACGEEGEGKLSDLETLMLYTYKAMRLSQHFYADKRVVVTAGGTRESIDGVREITNRSSGKMGLALADELFAMGAEVRLIHTLDDIKRPYKTIQVSKASEMAEMTRSEFERSDGLVMAAAVSDFTPANSSAQKIKKTDTLSLDLVKTEDILLSLVPSKKRRQFIIGFSADTNHVVQHAREKMERKHLDLIVANDVSRSDIGFGSEENEVTMLFEDKERLHLDKSTKTDIARQILEHFYFKKLYKRKRKIRISEAPVAKR